MTARIAVLRLHPLSTSTSVKAFVDIQVGALAIKGIKIIQQPGQKPWLGMPAIKTERAWSNVLEVTSRDLRERMTTVAIDAWQASQQPPPPESGETDPRQEHIAELARAFDARGPE